MTTHTPLERELNRGKTARNLRRWFCGLLLALAIPVDAGSPLTMIVSPTMSMSPSTVKIRVGVEPDASNRSLTIIADSGEFYRSSLIALEGDSAPRNIVVSYPRLPAGNYVISGALTDNEGHVRAIVKREIIVTPGGD